MERFRIFERFQLNNLDPEWINSLWDGEFLTYPDLPLEYLSFLESENVEILLMETCTVIKDWISENDSEFEVRWQSLNSLGINIRGLLALLGCVMKIGQRNRSDEDSRQSCLRACSLYFMLLAVPGSSVYQVFHPNLFHRAIETFKLSHLLTPLAKKSSRSMDFEDLYINNEEPSETLAHSEQVTLIRALNCLMFDLITMLKTFFVRDKPQSLDIIVQSLVESSKLETSFNHFQTHNKTKDASLSSLSYNAYVALQELCNPHHGPVDLTIQLIAKYALPHLSSTYTELPQKSLVVVQETTIHFLKNLLDSKESEAEAGILTLIQHLMANCPDRLEFRQKQAAVVTKLINICKGDLFLKAMENLVLFSHHNKVTCRIFAQEIISKCLTETMLDSEVAGRMKAKKILVAVALGRCVDSSSLVRGRAMAIIANCTEVDNPNRLTIQDIFEDSERDETFPPTLDHLRKAIFEDIDPLPNSFLMYSMLKERLEDERALVRRSALQVLRNVTNIFPAIVDQIATTLGLRCRDPALTVRSFAIQVLTQLLQENFENSILIDSWIRSIVPQVYDIEPKVQEKALESLQSLILDSIKVYSEKDTRNKENLPWVILQRLTKEKMRKHLSKACELWKKSELLNRPLVSKIQTHVGTENNIPAWVLLAALSETMQLSLMDRHFLDYVSLFQGKDFCARLKLEVLRNSWPSMNRDFLQQLFEDLIKSLSKFEVNLVLISICFDILAGIAKNLEEEMEVKMRELMLLCEIQIEKIFGNDKEEALDAEPVYIKAMCTLGHAAFLCTAKTSSSSVRTLQGLLLQWENIPRLLQSKKEMQASAIVLLGQLAMRDREIAEETMPIFGKLMSQPADANSKTESANKINSAKTLADLCIRFTALVESYLPDMCVSMKDPNPLVREVIVVIFIQLLLEDFIKVKGPFFFHILTMLTDTDETIRELTVFLIKERLLAKNKTLVSQQFLKSIFHYNDCQKINKFSIQAMREREKKALTLPGRENEAKRRMIYDFMLEHLDPPGKLKLICRMTSEILAGACDNDIDIKLEAEASILRDVLYLLSSEHLQASLCRQTDEDSQEETGNVPTAPSSKAIHEIVEGIKRHRLEVLLPVVVKLKMKLAQIKSPLLAEVSKFFVKIVSDFNKEQLSGLCNEYPNLEKDIESDSRKYGKKAHNDEENEMEDVPSVEAERFNKNLKTGSTRSPKIVLRRLSTLTYGGGKSTNPPGIDSDVSRPETPRNLNFSRCSSPRQRHESPEPGPSSRTARR